VPRCRLSKLYPESCTPQTHLQGSVDVAVWYQRLLHVLQELEWDAEEGKCKIGSDTGVKDDSGGLVEGSRPHHGKDGKHDAQHALRLLRNAEERMRVMVRSDGDGGAYV
jgi:hypothetical protein